MAAPSSLLDLITTAETQKEDAVAKRIARQAADAQVVTDQALASQAGSAEAAAAAELDHTRQQIHAAIDQTYVLSTPAA